MVHAKIKLSDSMPLSPLPEFFIDKLRLLQQYVTEDFYPQQRENFVLNVFLPFNQLWLPALNSRTLKIQQINQLHNAILKFSYAGPNSADSSLHQHLGVLEFEHLSRKEHFQLLQIWRSLSTVDINSQIKVLEWIQFSYPLVPQHLIGNRFNNVSPRMVYLTMLLMLASYGDYPICLCARILELDDGNIPFDPTGKFWIDRYLQKFIGNQQQLNREANLSLSRQPVDNICVIMFLIYLGQHGKMSTTSQNWQSGNF